jgi:hypothetical protein
VFDVGDSAAGWGSVAARGCISATLGGCFTSVLRRKSYAKGHEARENPTTPVHIGADPPRVGDNCYCYCTLILPLRCHPNCRRTGTELASSDSRAEPAASRCLPIGTDASLMAQCRCSESYGRGKGLYDSKCCWHGYRALRTTRRARERDGQKSAITQKRRRKLSCKHEKQTRRHLRESTALRRQNDDLEAAAREQVTKIQHLELEIKRLTTYAGQDKATIKSFKERLQVAGESPGGAGQHEYRTQGTRRAGDEIR